jgi:3-oxoadipate enol-lactonase
MPLIRNRGVDLFYDLSGPEDAPAVAFSNSIGTTLEMWDRQIPALTSRYRCLRYDTRGHGRSPTVDESVAIEDLADDLAGLLDALGLEEAHIVGLSLGGMTAQAFGQRHATRAKSIVLMATSAYLPHGWDERAAIVRTKGMEAIVDPVLARWFTPTFAADHPDVVTAFRARFLANDARGYAACCEAIRDMDLRPGNVGLQQPMLIIAGADDAATPVPMMEDIRATAPQADLIVLSRAAHILAIERADGVNRFLKALLDDVEDGRSLSPAR